MNLVTERSKLGYGVGLIRILLVEILQMRPIMFQMNVLNEK